MPFKCIITNENNGVTIEHWVESELVYNMEKGIVVFTVNGYLSKAAYDAGKQPILSKFFEIPEGTQPELAAAGKAFLLNYVRALPEFTGSEDA
jgi:hypothetical protein